MKTSSLLSVIALSGLMLFSWTPSIAQNTDNSYYYNTNYKVDQPVDASFSKVNVSYDGHSARLNWLTDNTSNDNISIERSLDGVNFASIALLTPTPGNTLYEYNDQNGYALAQPFVFYRLRMINAQANNISYTSPVTALAKSGNTQDHYQPGMVLYPVPVTNGVLNASIYLGNPQSLSVYLVNANGVTIWQQNYSVENTSASIALDLGNIPIGIYFLNVTGTKGLSLSQTINISGY